jgi:hypothetical protein
MLSVLGSSGKSDRMALGWSYRSYIAMSGACGTTHLGSTVYEPESQYS